MELEVKKYFPQSNNLSVFEILNTPQVLNVSEKDISIISKRSIKLTKKCIENYLDSCTREGERLKVQILKCHHITQFKQKSKILHNVNFNENAVDI